MFSDGTLKTEYPVAGIFRLYEYLLFVLKIE